MRFVLGILCVMLLSACGTNYRYQSESNPQQWQGKKIAVLQQQWGDASDIMHTRNGTSYYLYLTNSAGNFFRSTTTNFAVYGTDAAMYPVSNQADLKCSTIFTTDKNGTIVNVTHQGSDCGGEWVARTH